MVVVHFARTRGAELLNRCLREDVDDQSLLATNRP